jgi:CheY-like chemotaxis protein
MASRRPPRVLLVEDCDHTRLAYAEALAEHGYRVIQACNGAEALVAVQAQVPDAVVTDIDMPLLDGIGLTLRLRAREETAHIPIIVVTGSALDSILRRADQAGCSACLLKPCGPGTLLETLAGLLARPAAQEESRRIA